MRIGELARPHFKRRSILGFFFDLNYAEISVYRYLVLNDEKTSVEIGEYLMRDRSTAYRLLKNLCSVGIVSKETRYLPKGGYYHVYRAKEPAALKEDLTYLLREFHNGIFDLLEEASDADDLLQAITSSISGEPVHRSRMTKPVKKAGTGRRKKSSGSEVRQEESEDEGSEEEEAGDEEEEEQIPIHLR